MKSENILTRRVYSLVIVMVLWATVIFGRLFFLHVVHSADYKQRAEHQQQRTIEVSPPRGVIFDRNGFLYHGRIKALSNGAREAGLNF